MKEPIKESCISTNHAKLGRRPRTNCRWFLQKCLEICKLRYMNCNVFFKAENTQHLKLVGKDFATQYQIPVKFQIQNYWTISVILL